jgi:hypothetical protein
MNNANDDDQEADRRRIFVDQCEKRLEAQWIEYRPWMLGVFESNPANWRIREAIEQMEGQIADKS